ncbi:arylacetamide deacetylase-like isoform X1 [Microcaecilia unicolor]|uniref:Arylacetamide deacetylase-like isoform X1 n=2 Tax=Microcaecilia unicolor TaxID=1415580 RepID=A0A6P7Z531_9AMPH|nr:arylacetamide deacetylase-like isoform X1 [Microcaecilia unicolor]
MAPILLCFLILSVLVAYYIYRPLPENVEEGWKVMIADFFLRSLGHLGSLSELLGLSHYMEIMNLYTDLKFTPPTSDENIKVTDTTFNKVPVRLYVPKKKSNKLRRAVIFIHGGGWCIGSPAMKGYDRLSRWTVERLNAIVVSVDYRLAPKHHFPVPFEDSYAVVKFFLQKEVLIEYGVDPNRICIAGDSAGGNLAAAVTQQLQDDAEVDIRPKIQALIYPALQPLDLDTPSYRDNGHMPILSKSLMVRFWSEYFTSDKSLFNAMSSNSLKLTESSQLFPFLYWPALLPEKMKKTHTYSHSLQSRMSEFAKKYPGILDPRAAPLLVDDAKLSRLPQTYILTCMYDVLRDDGVIYAQRLRKAGVEVTHDQYDTFHGVMMFVAFPTDLSIGHTMTDRYLKWLNEKL